MAFSRFATFNAEEFSKCIKTIIGYGFHMISRIIQTKVKVIRLSFALAKNYGKIQTTVYCNYITAQQFLHVDFQ